MKRLHPIAFVIPLGSLILVWLLASNIPTLLSSTQQPCPTTAEIEIAGNQPALPNPALVLIGVGSMVLGATARHIRLQRHYALAAASGPALSAQAERAILDGASVIFFLGVTLAMLYEAIGVGRVDLNSLSGVSRQVADQRGTPDTAQPLTYYVRCAIHYDTYPGVTDAAQATAAARHWPWQTTFVVAYLGFILGHWLWYPPLRFRVGWPWGQRP